jgi:hypothetical protein
LVPGEGRLGGAGDGGGDHGEIESGSALLPQRVAVGPVLDLLEQPAHRPQHVAVRAVRAGGAAVEGHEQLLATVLSPEHALPGRDEHDVHAFERRRDRLLGRRRGPEVEQILVGEHAARLPARDPLNLPVGESHLQRQAKGLHSCWVGGRTGCRSHGTCTPPRRCDASPGGHGEPAHLTSSQALLLRLRSGPAEAGR